MKRIIILFILLTSQIAAQDYLKAQYDKADALYNDGQFYDAVTEFKRLNFFDSDNAFGFESNYKIALSYKAGARLDEAVKYFAIAEQHADTEDDIYEIKTEIIRTNILRRTTERAFQLLDELSADSRFQDKADDIIYWRGWAYIFADQWDKAAEEFSKLNPSHQLKTLAEKVESEKYSVTTAKVFSFIIPGAGQIYTGNILSGLLSLGWNVLWGYLTIDAFSNNRVFDGAAIGALLWIRFYRGNVQNAEKFAVNKNLEIANETLRFIKDNYGGKKP